MLKKKNKAPEAPPAPPPEPYLVLNVDLAGFNNANALYAGVITMIDGVIKAQGPDHVAAVHALATLAQAAATNALAHATLLAAGPVKFKVKP